VRLVCALLLGVAVPLGAQISRFAGTWKNIDPSTGTLTRLRVDAVGADLQIHAWGKCAPADCAWGAAKGAAYGSSVRDNVAAAARVLSTVFVTEFSEVLLIIHPADRGQLRVEVLTRYTDQSGRTGVSNVATFERVWENASSRRDSIASAVLLHAAPPTEASR
jgi:hypothetical protein